MVVNIMNLNSMSERIPIQPPNPTDSQRDYLSQYALYLKGRPEDFPIIKKILSPPPAITTIAKPGAFRNKKVGIIGAGLAGLASAYELRKLGFDITIFEANEERIGGRVYTYYFDKAKNLYGEFGAMRIPVIHETVWHYINLFKLPTRTFIQSNKNAFIYLRNVRVRNDPSGYNVMKYIYPHYNLSPIERTMSWQQLTYKGIESHLLYADPVQRAEIIQVKPSYSYYPLLWNRYDTRKMMEFAGLSEDAINLVSSLSPLMSGNLYNSYIDLVQENYPADLTFLYEIPGGLSRLPLSFYNALLDKNGGKNNGNAYPGIDIRDLGRVSIKMGCPVKGIYLNENNNQVILEYTNKQFGTNRENFDFVVCAIPFSCLRTIEIQPLFSSIKMQAIKEVNYTTAQKILILFKRRFWESGGPDEQIIGGGSYTDLPLASIWYPSDHADKCRDYIDFAMHNKPCYSLHFPENQKNSYAMEPGVLVASYNFNLDARRLTNLPENYIYIEIIRELEKVHGLPKGYLDNIAGPMKTINWDEEPWTRGALCFFAPEQKRLFSYQMAMPEYSGRVFFAGEHISAVHRWLQGALHSGMVAANMLALACKQQSQATN